MLLDLDVRVQRSDRLLRRVDLGDTDALGVVDHLALEVGEVDDVVVDDPERADPGRGQVQRRGRAEAAGAEQQHLGVEQLLLAVDPDLVKQQVARVAVALLGAHEARDLDLVAAILPQREAAGHRGHVLVAEILDQRARGPRGALPGGAVQDHGGGLVGRGALDARLEVALGHVPRAGEVAGGPLLVLAHVDHERSGSGAAHARRPGRPRRSGP